MKNTNRLSLIVLCTAFLLNPSSVTTAAEKEDKQERPGAPSMSESVHFPWLKIHLGKSLVQGVTPPPRQKVELFDENTKFFAADDRLYFTANNNIKVSGTD